VSTALANSDLVSAVLAGAQRVIRAFHSDEAGWFRVQVVEQAGRTNLDGRWKASELGEVVEDQGEGDAQMLEDTVRE